MNLLQNVYVDLNLSPYTPFASLFLSSENLDVLLKLQIEQLRNQVRDNAVTLVWSQGMAQAAVRFALKHYYMTSLDLANRQFVREHGQVNETQYLENSAWKRWCTQGFPNPRNMPRPLPSERRHNTIELTDYSLSAGTSRF